MEHREHGENRWRGEADYVLRIGLCRARGEIPVSEGDEARLAEGKEGELSAEDCRLTATGVTIPPLEEVSLGWRKSSASRFFPVGVLYDASRSIDAVRVASSSEWRTAQGR